MPGPLAANAAAGEEGTTTLMHLMDRRTNHDTTPTTLAGRRATERAMIDEYAARTGISPLTTQWVALADVSGVQIDGVNETQDLFVVASAHTRPLAAAELPHLARDIFSLSLVARRRPGSRAVLLFAGEPARASAEDFVARIAGEQTIELDVVRPAVA